MNSPYQTRWMRILTALMLILVGLSCNLPLVVQRQGQATRIPGGTPGGGATATPAALAEITFNVFIPTSLNTGESLAIGLLDEVTGLGLNPVLYPMTELDGQQFTAKLPLGLNSVIKYRYYRQGAVPALEDSALGNPVRYRIYSVTGPGSVDDRVASWSDTSFSGSLGEINGVVLDAATGRPIPNILVTAVGVSTLSDSLGQYILGGLPEGTHMLVGYALDGAYLPFQQGAVVAGGLLTTAQISIMATPNVQVTFIASLPADTVAGAPVRLAGNLIQLGNTFADLSGGISMLSAKMPTLVSLPDGRHGVTMRLPVGADIRYKYTLGDGFWNAEHASDESFVLRQLIVPTRDVVVQDTIATWLAGSKSAPILFEVTVPDNTPVGENISIQFNPFGWTEPLPMWTQGNNHWIYKLYGPLNMLSTFQYRYCRNDQCGSADDVQTAGISAEGRSVSTSLIGENLQDTVDSWAWWPESEPATLEAVVVKAHPATFWAGVEFSPNYDPTWQAFLPAAMQNVQDLGSSYVVLTPSWTASLANSLTFAPIPGSDPLWADTVQAVQVARAQNLNVAIYAIPRLLPSTADFWLQAPRSAVWWNAWFDRYRAFVLYHADLAANSGAQALILGGEAVLPSLPGGLLVNGSPSNAPADADARWRNIISDARQRFTGQILWAHPYSGGSILPAPSFMDQFYAFYLLWSAPLAANPSATIESMSNDAVEKLDNEIAPFLLKANKGAVIAVDYPSAQGAATGCVPSDARGCLDWSVLSQPYPDMPSAELDLQAQADIYQAVLLAINQRDWVGGFISRGYYLPLPLMDKSSSARGKMTADLLWYWFPRMRGLTR